jgi:hypothetical protein
MKAIAFLFLLFICLASRSETVAGVEVSINADAVPVEGRPTSAVAVTQCNLLVAVFLTMPDGRLIHFDSSSGISHDKLLSMAYTAKRSERVEVGCDDVGVKGYEKHEGVEL